MAEPKTYYNPINGEYTTILESSADTGGEYSHFEVSLKPGGGNPLHYHENFTEEFFPVKGTLSLQQDKEILHLKPGENHLVPTGAVHRFFNSTGEEIVFRVILRNGQPGFENFIKVMFGLVNDGRTNKHHLPKNIYHTAILLNWGDTKPNSRFFKLAEPLVNAIYRRAIRRGVDRQLLEKYCR